MEQGPAPEQLFETAANQDQIAKMLLEFAAVCVRGFHADFDLKGKIQDGTIQRGFTFSVDKQVR